MSGRTLITYREKINSLREQGDTSLERLEFYLRCCEDDATRNTINPVYKEQRIQWVRAYKVYIKEVKAQLLIGV